MSYVFFVNQKSPPFILSQLEGIVGLEVDKKYLIWEKINGWVQKGIKRLKNFGTFDDSEHLNN